MKFDARNVAGVERDSTSTILHARISGVDTQCNLAFLCTQCCTVYLGL